MYLSEDLITSVKRRANIPTSQVTFQNTDFLALADEEIRSKMIPLILRHMEEFYVYHLDQLVINGQENYAIPSRAVAMTLRDVQMIDETDSDTRVGLERLNPEDMYTGVAGNARFLVKKTGFYLENNTLFVYPMPVSSGAILRMSFYMRPNQLIPTANCGFITSINSALNQFTVSALPSTITVNTLVDFVKANPGFECMTYDEAISGISGNTVTMVNALPLNLSLGDYVCPATQSCVVQVPVEFQPLLFQYVVIRVLSAQGDQANLKAAVAELADLEKSAGTLIAPRVSGKVKRVTNSRNISRWV